MFESFDAFVYGAGGEFYGVRECGEGCSRVGEECLHDLGVFLVVGFWAALLVCFDAIRGYFFVGVGECESFLFDDEVDFFVLDVFAEFFEE